MVFQRQGRKVFFLKLTDPRSGLAVTLSCRTPERETAEDVASVCKRYVARRRWDVVDLLTSKRLDPGALYDADVIGGAEALIATFTQPEPVVDLRPYEAVWAREVAGAAYAGQLRTLYPSTEPLTLATFARKPLLQKLKALPVQRPTKNRYKAACSSFAAHLVDEEVLEFNFVRTIKGFGEHDPRVVYYPMADAKRLVQGLAQPFAGIAAYQLAFAAEWGTVPRLLVGDVTLDGDPVTVRVRGTKRAWRDRVVPLVPELAWALDYIRPHLTGKMATASVFPMLRERVVLTTQQATAKALQIVAVGEDVFGPHTLHDWRHTHAVALTRAGYVEQIVADHLGHKNTDLVRKRYGLFKPDRHDYAKRARPDKSETRRRNHAK